MSTSAPTAPTTLAPFGPFVMVELTIGSQTTLYTRISSANNGTWEADYGNGVTATLREYDAQIQRLLDGPENAVVL